MFSAATASTRWRVSELYFLTTYIYIYIYIYIYTHTHTHTHTHTPDCVEAAYEVQFPPNNTANEIFLHKSEKMRSGNWVFITGALVWRGLGKYGTLDKTFNNLRFKEKASPVTSTFSSLSHS